MLATIDSDLIQEAIRVALRLSPPITGNFTFEVKGAKLYLHSLAELSRCTILIPGEIKGKGLFAIPSEALRDATKGRATVELMYDKTLLHVKSGRYLVKLTTVDAIEPEEEDKLDGDVWQVTAPQMQWLKSAVTNVGLKPTQNLTQFMPVSVILSSKNAFVSCYDGNHMMFETSKEIIGKLDVTLPIETLTAVLDVFNKVEAKLTVTSSALHVRNPMVDVVLALPATEEESVSATEVREKAREALKADGQALDLEKKWVLDFLTNARSVYDKSRSELHVAVADSMVTMTVKTTLGTARNKTKAGTRAALDFKIDLEYFEEAVRKCGDRVPIKYVDSFIMVKTANAHSLIALNQE
jgi:hypothetical protein